MFSKSSSRKLILSMVVQKWSKTFTSQGPDGLNEQQLVNVRGAAYSWNGGCKLPGLLQYIQVYQAFQHRF